MLTRLYENFESKNNNLKKRKLEKLVNSNKGTLYELANTIDSSLKKNKVKCILDYYGDYLDCSLDLRSFGTKLKDVFNSFTSDDGNLRVCSIIPLSEGNNWNFDKFKVIPQFGDKELNHKTKKLNYNDAEQYVLNLFDSANKFYSSLNK